MKFDWEEIGLLLMENPMSLVYGLIGLIILIFLAFLIGGNIVAGFIQNFFNPFVVIISAVAGYVSAKKPSLLIPLILLTTFFVWGYGLYLQLSNPAWYCQIPIIGWFCNAFSLGPWIFDLIIKGGVFFIQIQLVAWVVKQLGWD